MDRLELAFDFLVENPLWSNVVASGVILVWALYYLFRRPEPLNTHAFARWAFGFWIFQWLSFVVFYLIRLRVAFAFWFELSLVDFQSLLVLAFAVAFLAGDDFAPRKLLRVLALVLAALTLYAYLVGLFIDAGSSAAARYAWLTPSAMLSLLSYYLLGAAFLLRFGWAALAMPIAVVGYIFLQWPIYTSEIVSQEADEWFLALAFGKLAVGSLFYFYFFVPLRRYERLMWEPIDERAREVMGRRLALGLKALAGFGLAILAGLLAALLI